MTDQQDNEGAKNGRRQADKSIIETPGYTGPERRKSPRRVIERRSEPRE